ncbi:MAG: gamma-glutamyl-gamma-aminobutyrate hydrolase family protein [Bacteroidales bacterium]|nr:gamma-glutamyl-gamma-aminobutyrate hydrolase family protein [Bacteroidales bacterium]
MRLLINRLSGAGLLVLLMTFTACQRMLPPPVIAISKASDNYINWLKRADSTVRYVNLYTLPFDSAFTVLDQCNGLLLTGGDDIYPGIYDRENDTARCETFDLYRDTLEINLIYKALEINMPVFGVCRGEQLLNVVFGGELIIDIPQDIQSPIPHRCDDYLTCFHMVYVEHNSFLHRLCNCDSALVTTNHHQAILILAPDLKANAYSPDHLIEGVELADLSKHPFLLAVQWHPERMEAANPLSGPLAAAFLQQCKVFMPANQ